MRIQPLQLREISHRIRELQDRVRKPPGDPGRGPGDSQRQCFSGPPVARYALKPSHVTRFRGLAPCGVDFKLRLLVFNPRLRANLEIQAAEGKPAEARHMIRF